MHDSYSNLNTIYPSPSVALFGVNTTIVAQTGVTYPATYPAICVLIITPYAFKEQNTQKFSRKTVRKECYLVRQF